MSRSITLRRPANRRKKGTDGPGPAFRAGLALLVAVLALGAFAGGGYALWRAVSESPHFNLRQVIVLHNDRAPAEEITALLGVDGDQNIFKLDLGALKADAELHPWVARARVYRRLPSTIVVDVTEHQPVAVLQSGGLFYISSGAVVFKAVRNDEDLDYPVVTGPDISAVKRGDPDALRGIREAVDLLAVVRAGGSPDTGSIEELHWDRNRGVTVYSTAAVPVVHLGTAPWETKWRQLQAIWMDLEERNLDVATIEFRSQRMAVLKLRFPPPVEKGGKAPAGHGTSERQTPAEVRIPLDGAGHHGVKTLEI